MTGGIVAPDRRCWCNNERLLPFGGNYLSCAVCGTLVSQVGLTPEQTQVRDDEADYYGKQYWLTHQGQDFGLPDIYSRARQDLPERCLHWLRTLLDYKLPPGQVLELGSAHGAFVALMNWAGYQALGLELSPWVADFAKKTFGIPMLVGAIEEQQLAEESFDVIVLNDLLEHLPHPETTLSRCAALLKRDGFLLMQTPEYPDNKTYEEMVANRQLFLEYIHSEPVAREHVYLYSRRAVRRLLERAGMSECLFEPPIFAYDMFVVAGKQPLARNSKEQIDRSLAATPAGRLVQALFDVSRREAGQLASLHLELEKSLAAIESLTTSCTHERHQVEALTGELQGVLQRESHQVYGLRAEIERICARESVQVARLQTEIERLQQGITESAARLETAQQAYYELEAQLEATRDKLAQFQDVGTIGLKLGQRLHRMSVRHPRISSVLRNIARAAG
jgi:2-polyprenyl-3-methyl-5-hydroxy-6-metoxy-1,4-benzoquinol methylase